MIEKDLSRVDECVTHSIHKLGLGYERCENKGEISTKFVHNSTYKDEGETLKANQIPYPPNPKSSFNPKRAQKQTTNPSMSNLDGVYTCMFCGHVGHLDEFCFWRKRMEKRRVDDARNSYHNEFIDFPPLISSRAPSHFSHGPNHHSYILVHERVALFLDALVLTHVLIVVLVPHVGTVLPLEVPIITLSQVTLMVHAFLVVVHVPLAQIVKYKSL
jgi:hypothetical protein